MRNLIAIIGVLVAAVPLIACDSGNSDQAKQQCSMATNPGAVVPADVQSSNGVCETQVAADLTAPGGAGSSGTGAPITPPAGFLPAASLNGTNGIPGTTPPGLVGAAPATPSVGSPLVTPPAYAPLNAALASLSKRNSVQSTISQANDVTGVTTPAPNRSVASQETSNSSSSSGGGSQTAQ